jgi:hypothetical protein
LRQKLAFACMLIAALIPAVFAILDVMSVQLAPYQQVAAGMQWAEVPPKLQSLFVTMSHLSGINLIGFSLGLLVLVLVPFRRGEGWADWAILVVEIPVALPAAYVLYNAASKTGAAFPWFGPLINLVLVIVGFLLSTNRRERQVRSQARA